MPSDCISYQNSGYFSKLIVDYLNQQPELQDFYNRFPTLENFKQQVDEKKNTYQNSNRSQLVSVLQEQYAYTETSELTRKNIALLANATTFTVTTGHQLNLFTGPLYFIYKIISTINLAKELNNQYPDTTIVPIYWMATEDHDFEEINYFNFKEKKIMWNKKSSGPVGRLSTTELKEISELFSKEVGKNSNGTYLIELFDKAYNQNLSLASATRYIANELFKEYGLVIIDADHPKLKKLFIPYIKEELINTTAHKNVSKTIEALQSYEVQVNPRAINLFYIEENLRERILFEEGSFLINNTAKKFTTEEIIQEVENQPEKFSPNVILRPLYQEMLLPNLCYIGGGGEIAYWLELYSFFKSAKVTFPILLVRNSALLTTQKQNKKAEKLGLSWQNLFSKQEELVALKAKELSEFPIDLSRYKKIIQEQFVELYKIANQTDTSFTGAVKAQEKKQLNGLAHLEKRLLKAQKRKYKLELSRITELQNELFPKKGLQERQLNFSEFYLEYGSEFISKLVSNLKPLEQKFEIIEL